MHGKTKAAAETLSDQIRSGKYPVNAFLPSERDLCADLGVGRGSLRAIQEELCKAGVLRRTSGRHGIQVLGFARRKLHRILVIRSVQYSEAVESLTLLDGISRKAEKSGIAILISTIDRATPYADAVITRFQKGEFQGIINIEQVIPSEQQKILDAGIPAVVANQEIEEPFPSVRVDYRDVGRIMGRTAVEAGHRHIGLITGPSDGYIYREMRRGIRGALAEDDLELDPRDVLFMEDGEDIYPSLKELLLSPDRPTLMLAGRDHRASHLFSCCRELGLSVPDDLSIVSYDNLSWKEAKTFGLTTIAEPAGAVGEEAVKLLANWVEHNSPDRIRKMHTELILRTSLKKL